MADTKTSAGKSSGMSAADIAAIGSTVGDVGATIIKTLGEVKDQKERRLFEQNLALLTNEQKNAFEKALLSANSETERLKIIRDVLTSLQSKRIDQLTANVTADEKRKRFNTIIAASVFIVIAVATVALISKKK